MKAAPDTAARQGNPPRAARVLTLTAVACIIVAAAASTLYAFWMANEYGLGTLFADQWRILYTFLSLPFPDNILASQNGHRPVFPNLFHLFNLRVLNWDGLFGMWFGFGLALACALLFFCAARKQAELAWHQSAIVAALPVMAVLHTSNGKLLFHSNDSVHCYLVLMALLLALWIMVFQRDTARTNGLPTLLSITFLGLVGMFSFGTGAVLFPTLIIIAVLQRRPAAFILALTIICAVAIYAYFIAIPGFSTGKALQSNNLGVGHLGLDWLLSIPRWMSAPIAEMTGNSRFVTAMGPDFSNRVTEVVQFWLGPVLFLLLFVYIFQLVVRHAAGNITLSSLALFHLGITIAMIGAGVLVAYTRRELWHTAPENVFTPRFFTWSTLIWSSGMCIAYLRISQHEGKTYSPAALACPMLITVLFVSSTTTHQTRSMLEGDLSLSRDTSLRTVMGLETQFWSADLLEVVTAEQILFVGKQFRERGIPVYSTDVDALFGSAIDSATHISGPGQRAIAWAVAHDNAIDGKYAVMTLESNGEQPIVYIIDEQDRVVGVLPRIHRYRSPTAVLRKKRKKYRIHKGLLAPYDRTVCYRYAIRQANGSYTVGALDYHGEARPPAHCALPAG